MEMRFLTEASALAGSLSVRNRSTPRFAGVFLSGARLREVAVIVLYIRIGGAVAELACNGWVARGGAGRLFFDDAFVLVTVVVFDHGWIGMTRAVGPLYGDESAIAGRRSVWD
jgi:hypothetical protein